MKTRNAIEWIKDETDRTARVEDSIATLAARQDCPLHPRRQLHRRLHLADSCQDASSVGMQGSITPCSKRLPPYEPAAASAAFRTPGISTARCG